MILVQHGFERAEMWKIYLPMMLAGAVTMVLAAIFAEVRNRFKEVMLFGIVLLLLSLVFMGFGQGQSRVVLYIVALYFFFMGFKKPRLFNYMLNHLKKDLHFHCIKIMTISHMRRIL